MGAILALRDHVPKVRPRLGYDHRKLHVCPGFPVTWGDMPFAGAATVRLCLGSTHR
jgi:hypothetical protein